ncbi:hypothetical protein ACQ4LE_004545 [Meloidogyne hapla]
MLFNLNKLTTTKTFKIFLYFIILIFFLSKNINAKSLNKEQKQLIPSMANENINQKLFFDNLFPSKFISKRRSAEFINGLLSLERLNSMGKRSMTPSLLWEY